MKSRKELNIDKKILKMLQGKTYDTAKMILEDKEIEFLQDYSNTVSIKRLGYNDHGPVHMRKVLLNALVIIDLLNKAGIKLNLEDEGIGTYEDSRIAVLIASFMHDTGMSVGRENHEISGVLISTPIIERILQNVYTNELEKRVILKALIMECMLGHMGTQKIHSLEAGIILIADGCDMERGRARIPMILSRESKIGDIHKYSSAAIESVSIEKGGEKPVKITVKMSESVGFFQVEEILLTKINSSPIKPYIELFAGVKDAELKRYL